MQVGYIRISTVGQNTARQEVLMQELGVEKVFIDRMSGKNTDRPQLKEMMAFVRQGDTVIVESISRFARNTRDLLDLVEQLTKKGHHLTVTIRELAPDLSTKGCFPKAWIRTGNDFRLLKDGGEEVVRRELLASKICQCFDVPQVAYEEYFYDGEVVTQSIIVTSKRYSMVSKMAYDVYAINNDLDTIEECIRLDPIVYYGMNILDYLVGNTDPHPENWGFLIDNATNLPVSLYPLMDFNMSFQAYDKLDGANCQTVGSRKLTQREAAIEAVKAIGLRKIRDIDLSIFEGKSQEREMFHLRLVELQKYAKLN